MNTKHITTISASFLTLFFTAAIVCAAPVPDTGQTQSYTNTFGEDPDYTFNPHSYTDLGNGVVRDNVTGLRVAEGNSPRHLYVAAGHRLL